MPTPMFPLGTVVMPGERLPLQLFEPRYLALVTDVMAGDKTFGTCLIERGSEVGGGDQRFDVGTLVDVVDARPTDDGRWLLQGVGRTRIRVEEWLPDDPYPLARIVEFPDPAAGEYEVAQLEAVRSQLRHVVTEFLARQGRQAPDGWLENLPTDPSLASFELAANCPAGPLDRHRLLAAPTVGLRLAVLDELIGDLPASGAGG